MPESDLQDEQPRRQATRKRKRDLARFPDELSACRYVADRVKYQDNDIVWEIACNHSNRGKAVGKLSPSGYRRIHVSGYGFLQVHRVIFFMFHGFLPRIVDHIDGNCMNNSIENLRAASYAQNSINCKTPVTNSSGRKGVYAHKATGKWQASIRAEGKLKYLGLFSDFDDAVAARKKAEEQYHGEFARN